MRVRFLIPAVAMAVAIGASPAIAQNVVGYGPQGAMVLVTPDGVILDQSPEYGSVDVYYNPKGQRVLVDRRGRLVATEVPLNSVRRGGRQRNRDQARLPRSGRNSSIQRLDLPESRRASRGSRNDYSNLDTGSIPGNQAPSSSDRTSPSYGVERTDPMQPEPSIKSLKSPAAKAQIAAMQVLLDRKGASPGVIDGRIGGNVQKALAAYATISGEHLKPTDKAEIHRELMATGGPAMTTYTITPSDAAGPYVASIPSDYAKKAEMKRLSYTSTAEMLAEKFHMDESYMKAINPGVDFSRPGTTIKVVNPGSKKRGAVTLIIADKAHAQVRGYDDAGKLIVAYPATIGSTDTPSPSGIVSVARIAPDPNYTYNPKINFKQAGNDGVLTVPPGPNGPVGNMWIALSKPTYGIHGTPAPSLIGKTNSHGCVRLTNWDAHELASMVKPGVTVKFVGTGT